MVELKSEKDVEYDVRCLIEYLKRLFVYIEELLKVEPETIEIMVANYGTYHGGFVWYIKPFDKMYRSYVSMRTQEEFSNQDSTWLAFIGCCEMIFLHKGSGDFNLSAVDVIIRKFGDVFKLDMVGIDSEHPGKVVFNIDKGWKLRVSKNSLGLTASLLRSVEENG